MNSGPKPGHPKLPLVFSTIALSLLMFSGSAFAFSRTIEDVANPAVNASVLSLEVEADRTLAAEHESFLGDTRAIDTRIAWNHSLSGTMLDSASTAQQPGITVRRAPTGLNLAGRLRTVVAEGSEDLKFLDGCLASRTTTKSDFLRVELALKLSRGSTASTNPAVSLATESLDPFVQTCPYRPTAPGPTAIRTFSTPTVTSTEINYSNWTSDLEQHWTPGKGELDTRADSCKPVYCDFTITGLNRNFASVPGWAGGATANAAFSLRLRLRYPRPPTPLPDSKITHGPKRLIKTSRKRVKVAFRFKARGAKATRFRCRLDRARPVRCSSPFRRNVRPGRHRFAVAAVHRGKVDPSPAVRTWTVKRIINR